MGNSKGNPPRLQFLWLPIDVKSPWKGFQACVLKNELEFVVFQGGSHLDCGLVAHMDEGGHFVI
jgi:hypothetical protein